MEFEEIAKLLSMGGDSATIFLAWFLWKLERRLHNVEVFTGLKKLVSPENS